MMEDDLKFKKEVKLLFLAHCLARALPTLKLSALKEEKKEEKTRKRRRKKGKESGLREHSSRSK